MEMQPSALSAAEVTALTRRHAELELAGDYEPLLATLVDEPVFEFHPPGGQLIGGDTLRRYYTRFLAEFMPLVEETILIGEWANDAACVHEYQLRLRVDGKLENHQLVGSVYGMNFKVMPELEWVHGYPMALVMMLIAAVVPYWIFKWKKWL